MSSSSSSSSLLLLLLLLSSIRTALFPLDFFLFGTTAVFKSLRKPFKQFLRISLKILSIPLSCISQYCGQVLSATNYLKDSYFVFQWVRVTAVCVSVCVCVCVCVSVCISVTASNFHYGLRINEIGEQYAGWYEIWRGARCWSSGGGVGGVGPAAAPERPPEVQYVGLMERNQSSPGANGHLHVHQVSSLDSSLTTVSTITFGWSEMDWNACLLLLTFEEECRKFVTSESHSVSNFNSFNCWMDALHPSVTLLY